MTTTLTLTLALQLLSTPDLNGLATYYNPTDFTPWFRNGDPITPAQGVEVAVDTRELQLIDKWIYVCSPHACGTFKVVDTGYLYRAGRFIPCQHRRGYCRSERGDRVVLDFTQVSFKRLSPDLGTVPIRAWSMQDLF